ncbi:NAD(P)-dependent alcohol dehydrogenase [Algoriphagus namhaensis]|uniref:NAD(P)-dependent alcohol dehydrogenase n=1 Tax=Algoriphagus namhaensis TaxID=915353 RepID=A0ABV8AS15_9BACT
MKAITISKYGQAIDLKWEEIPKPIPKKDEVLIKVMCTAVNDFDWSYVRGEPRAYRLFFGISKPKFPVPGMEVSGVIEQVGESVNDLKIGDRVFGDISEFGFGSFAEYLCVKEKALAKMPDRMSFEHAASLPHAGLLAWQGLVDLGKIQTGQKVLINGGGGGVGSFGVQIAKSFGCQVTGVDSADKFESMNALGFDTCIDYRKVDFTKTGKQYDLILDCRATRSPFAIAKSLTQNGTCIVIGGTVGVMLQFLFAGKIAELGSGKSLKILPLKTNQGLEKLNERYTNGTLKCTIDGPYPLAEAGKWIQYFGEGKHIGKVVLKATEDS